MAQPLALRAWRRAAPIPDPSLNIVHKMTCLSCPPHMRSAKRQQVRRPKMQNQMITSQHPSSLMGKPPQKPTRRPATEGPSQLSQANSLFSNPVNGAAPQVMRMRGVQAINFWQPSIHCTLSHTVRAQLSSAHQKRHPRATTGFCRSTWSHACSDSMSNRGSGKYKASALLRHTRSRTAPSSALNPASSPGSDGALPKSHSTRCAQPKPEKTTALTPCPGKVLSPTQYSPWHARASKT